MLRNMGEAGDLYWWEMMEPRGREPNEAFAGGRKSIYWDDLPNMNIFVGRMEGREGRVERVYERVLVTFHEDFREGNPKPWIVQKEEECKFEILCVSKKAVADWIDIEGEDVPENAVVAGKNADTGENVYVGRGFHDEHQATTGYMIPSITTGAINFTEHCLLVLANLKLDKFQALVLR